MLSTFLKQVQRQCSRKNAHANHYTYGAKIANQGPQKQISLQIKQIDKIIVDMIGMDEKLSRKLAILISIPGIGQATAFSMLIDMPELGTMSANKLPALPVLHHFPANQENGKAKSVFKVAGRSFDERCICLLFALFATT